MQGDGAPIGVPEAGFRTIEAINRCGWHCGGWSFALVSEAAETGEARCKIAGANKQIQVPRQAAKAEIAVSVNGEGRAVERDGFDARL